MDVSKAPIYIELSPDQTKDLPFPHGCPVLYWDGKQVSIGLVDRVDIDLNSASRENLISIKGDSRCSCNHISEKLVQYAPRCPVWFKANDGTCKTAKVLTSGTDENEVLTYEIEIVQESSADAAEAAHLYGVTTNQLSYRPSTDGDIQQQQESNGVTPRYQVKTAAGGEPPRRSPVDVTHFHQAMANQQNSRSSSSADEADMGPPPANDAKPRRDVVDAACQQKRQKTQHEPVDDPELYFTFFQLPLWMELERIQNILDPETTRKIMTETGCDCITVLQAHEDDPQHNVDCPCSAHLRIVLRSTNEEALKQALYWIRNLLQKKLDSAEHHLLQQQSRHWDMSAPASCKRSEHDPLMGKEIEVGAEVEQDSTISLPPAVGNGGIEPQAQVRIPLWVSSYLYLEDIEKIVNRCARYPGCNIRTEQVNENDLFFVFSAADRASRQAIMHTIEDLILNRLQRAERCRLLFDWAVDGGLADSLERGWDETGSNLIPVKQRSAWNGDETVWMLVIDIEPYMTGYIVGNGGKTVISIGATYHVEVDVVGKRDTEFPFVYIEGQRAEDVQNAGKRVQELALASARSKSGAGRTREQPTNDRYGHYGPAQGSSVDSRATRVEEEKDKVRTLKLPWWVGDTEQVSHLLEDAKEMESQFGCSIEIRNSQTSGSYPLRVRVEPENEAVMEHIISLLLSGYHDMSSGNRRMLGGRLLYEFAVQRDAEQGTERPWVVRQKRSVDSNSECAYGPGCAYGPSGGEFVYGLVVELRPEDPKEVGAILGHKGMFHKKLQSEFGTTIGIVDHEQFPPSPFVFIHGPSREDVEATGVNVQKLLLARPGRRQH